MHLHNYYHTKRSALLLFPGATKTGAAMGGCKCGNIQPINVPECYGGEISFLIPTDQTHQKFANCKPASALPLLTSWKPRIRSFKRDTITPNVVSVKLSRRIKKSILTRQRRNLVLHCLVRTSHTLLEAMWVMT